MRDGWVADSFEQAAEEFGTHYVNETMFYFRQGIYTHHPDFNTEADITIEKLRPPDHRRRAAVHRAARALPRGVRRRLLHDALPDVEGPSLEMAAEQIRRFGEEVVQPIHKKYPAPDHPAIPAVCRW